MPRTTANSMASADQFPDLEEWERSRSNSGTPTPRNMNGSNSEAGPGARNGKASIAKSPSLAKGKGKRRIVELEDDSDITDEDPAVSRSTKKGKGKAPETVDSEELSSDSQETEDEDALRAALEDDESLLDSASEGEGAQSDSSAGGGGTTSVDDAALSNDSEEEVEEDPPEDQSDNEGMFLATETARIVADEEARRDRKSSKRFRKRSLIDHPWGQDPDIELDSDEERNEWYLPGSGAGTTLSPNTLRALGLSDDIGEELFEEQDGFRTDSEPSFTDFFDDTDSPAEDGDEDTDEEGDSDALTTDDDSSLDEAFMAAILAGGPLVVARGEAGDDVALDEDFMEGLIEGLDDSDVAEARRRAEMPLLVIEDLDGRLIYARAGDGEAVFGSDGEFEYLGDSDQDEDWSDYEDDLYNALMASTRTRAEEEVPDDGETTDELPEEEVQFSRLLVGSIAPRGGRQSRRHRALAARHRKLGPSTSQRDVTGGQTLLQPSPGGHSRENSANSVSDVLSDATLATALSAEQGESADAITQGPPNGITQESAVAAAVEQNSEQAESANGGSSASTTTPATPHPKPVMGSFLPSSNAKHRAVIDGLRAAPSPFSLHNRIRNKGLGLKAKRKLGQSESMQSAKRQRRFSIDDIARPPLHLDLETAAGSLSDNPDDFELVNLEDLVDASMLWRPSGNASDTSSREPGKGDDGTKDARAGINTSAIARWNKVPMGTFRDGQQQQQRAADPLSGASPFLREMRRGGNRAARLDSSPFRGQAVDRSRPGFSGIDSMLVPTTLPGSAGGVVSQSPILFPTTGEGASSHAQQPALSRVPTFDLQSEGSRKVTRREKREKKARKDALRTALLAGHQHATVPSTPVARSEVGSAPTSPTALTVPHLSFSSASPLHSAGASAPTTAEGPPPNFLRGGSPSPSKARPVEQIAQLQAGPNSATGHDVHAPASQLPSLAPPSTEAPSSAVRAPLYSPLFGGIAPPPGFSDDPDDDRTEPLMI